MKLYNFVVLSFTVQFVLCELKINTYGHFCCLFVLNVSILDMNAEAVPKKILELMNVPGLTRENVASHLQVILDFYF